MPRRRKAFFSAALLAGLCACADKPREGYGAVRQRIDVPDADADVDADADAGVSPDADAALDVDAASMCAHPLCAPGVMLTATCDPCATTLCTQDPYCCTVAWDLTCVGEVTSICALSCVPDAGANDTGTAPCAHPICATGTPLVGACDPCATSLCALDPYCCTVAWDGTCVNEVGSICAKTCN